VRDLDALREREQLVLEVQQLELTALTLLSW